MIPTCPCLFQEAALREKYSREVTVQDILNMYDDPEAYFSNLDRKVSASYEKVALSQLKREFRSVSVNIITQKFAKNKKLYYPSYKALKSYNGPKRKTKRPDTECATPEINDLNFLKVIELIFSQSH